MSDDGRQPIPEQIVSLNVGGQKFATSSHTLTWIPDSFFTSLLSGRIPSVRDASGAIFIDRDPDAFRVVLNYLRTKQVDLSSITPATLKHEAQFYNLAPLVRRLTLCEELETSSCGSVLFHALIPPPDLPFEKREAKSTEKATKHGGSSSSSQSPLDSSPPSGVSARAYGSLKKNSWELNRIVKGELSLYKQQHEGQSRDCGEDPLRIRVVKAHYSTVVVAYAYYACVYRMKESIGWQTVYITSRLDSVIKQVALNTKFGAQNTDRMLALALANFNIHLWCLCDEGSAVKRGTFSLGVAVDKLFFIGSQMVALSKTGKVGIWQSVNQNWQVQDLVPISCYDTAGSSLLLGCTNGSMYYIDMQKFPLRMKDNDLLITELYRDPSGDCITAISVYLTPKTTVCGNWIEIAYGTSSGTVRVIVQHPETVGHGPQLFQTYTVHNSPVTKVALNTSHLISVCSEYNHVRTWAVTRFRGMISTQPGSTSIASFKILTLDSDDANERDNTDVGPFGDQDGEQVFVQRVVPDTNQVFVRLASTGDRICTIKTVDGAAITSFAVHECEGSSRMGSRPRRYLFCGTSTGNVQMWDLTTALDQFHALRQVQPGSTLVGPSAGGQGDAREQQVKPPTQAAKLPASLVQGLSGPTAEELLQLIDECDICCGSMTTTPAETPHASTAHLPALDYGRG